MAGRQLRKHLQAAGLQELGGGAGSSSGSESEAEGAPAPAPFNPFDLLTDDDQDDKVNGRALLGVPAGPALHMHPARAPPRLCRLPRPLAGTARPRRRLQCRNLQP